ncbi:hypothetical protein IF1G_05739 [Cordyceps javanica]|uniref:Uncharacterized protein n=1 Tax=Cordyceps javanica TaxID=43265 RepID=A0A545V2G6_9HYPO|nr:hypothetical protein IF1G_05739 [Cordyceps javanica]
MAVGTLPNSVCSFSILVASPGASVLAQAQVCYRYLNQVTLGTLLDSHHEAVIRRRRYWTSCLPAYSLGHLCTQHSSTLTCKRFYPLSLPPPFLPLFFHSSFTHTSLPPLPRQSHTSPLLNPRLSLVPLSPIIPRSTPDQTLSRRCRTGHQPNVPSHLNGNSAKYCPDERGHLQTHQRSSSQHAKQGTVHASKKDCFFIHSSDRPPIDTPPPMRITVKASPPTVMIHRLSTKQPHPHHPPSSSHASTLQISTPPTYDILTKRTERSPVLLLTAATLPPLASVKSTAPIRLATLGTNP